LLTLNQLIRFINDIFYFVKKGTLYNYADDNTLSYGHPDFNVLTSVLESELNVLINWFKVNKEGIQELIC
jgi:hypothetical protein